MRRHSRGLKRAAGAVVLAVAAVAAAAGLDAFVPTVHAAAVQTPATSAYVPVAPARIVDTRGAAPFGATPTGRLSGGDTVRVQVVGRDEATVPADATAVVLNVTAVDSADSGYVSVFPSGSARPEVSNLNMPAAGYTGANLVTVRLGDGGAIDVFTSATTDVLVDVAGYYAPTGGAVAAGRTLVVGPSRLYDSRSLGEAGRFRPGSARQLTLDAVPADASAAVLNVTVTDTTGSGFWSVVPPHAPLDSNGAPTTSSINVTRSAANVASQVIVPIAAAKQILLYSSGGGHVIVDLFGYVTGPSAPVSTDGLFVALAAPTRLLDTRGANTPLGAGHRLWPDWIAEVAVAGRGGIPTAGVAAVVGNLTSVDPHGGGWVAAFPAGTTYPGTSTLNTDVAGTVMPNHLIAQVSTRGVSLLTSAGGHLLLDVAGYLTGTASAATEATVTNAMPLPKYPLQLSIPAIGITASLQADAQPADLIHGPGWWPGTSYPGVRGNMAVFGHRTEAGGPFRNVNRLRPGDRVTVSGDHRTSVYEVQSWSVVSAANVDRFLPDGDGTTLTLIACSKADGTASSLAYRIVVTATLVSYTDT